MVAPPPFVKTQTIPVGRDRWQRHLLGEDSPSDVGGCVLDVDGNGVLDFVRVDFDDGVGNLGNTVS